ncbi:52 kDa repressor of the inhibitor of the protein kinase-like isoform X3, partial [Aphis craccivora]
MILVQNIKNNRQWLIPIIDCVILCGRQEIAMRGHTDSGKIDFESSLNRGNFRAILKYRAKCDEYLKQILTHEGRNKYITPQIQNEIIIACGDVILNKIVKRVNEFGCFSVLVDETSDICTKEQMALCLRYVDDSFCIHESFLKFITVNSLTGCNLAESIINGLISCGINCDFLFGQGYDGASNMSGQYKGVQSIIKAQYPHAIYVHCAAHSLNLAISTASEIQSIRNFLGIIEKFYVFFNTPKRNTVLLNCIEKSDEEPKVKTLKDCVQQDGLDSLDVIKDWNDTTATDASLLLKSIDTEFLISLQVVK